MIGEFHLVSDAHEERADDDFAIGFFDDCDGGSGFSVHKAGDKGEVREGSGKQRVERAAMLEADIGRAAYERPPVTEEFAGAEADASLASIRRITMRPETGSASS